MRKLSYLYVVPYLLILVAIFGALNPLWLRSYPSLKLYSGELAFSGERAFEDLKTLLALFPERAAGSENNKASAHWMADQFQKIGLDTKLEVFHTFVPEQIWAPDFLFQPMINTHKQITGTNVVAFSRGKSPAVVLFMAHRDVVPSSASRDGDNASGNAALLEIARVLAVGEHFYSYLFVSTDVEESGEQGAYFLSKFHPDLSLKLAISVDDVGYRDAQTISLYNIGNARQSTPLWTVALAHNVMSVQGLTRAYLNSQSGWTDTMGIDHPFFLLASLLNQHGLGSRSFTDSEVFLERGDAVLGVKAVDPQARSGLPALWVPGSSEDTAEDLIRQMSPLTLSMAGRFLEQYVRSLELNQFDELMETRLYVTWQDRFLPPMAVRVFSGLVLAAFAFLVFLPFISPVVHWDSFLNFLQRDAPWLAEIVIVSVLAGLVWLIPRLSLFHFLPPIVYLALTVFLVVYGGIRIVRRRRYFLRLWHYEPTVLHQRRMLVLAIIVLYVAYSLLFSSFTAGSLLFFPLLVWSMARYRQAQAQKAWLFLFGAWTVLHGLFSLLVLYTAVSRIPPWTLVGITTFTLSAALWLVTLVYVFSTPPLGVIERR